jgi:hypothetical protein
MINKVGIKIVISDALIGYASLRRLLNHNFGGIAYTIY